MVEVPPNILAVIVPRELSFKLLKYTMINEIRREQTQNTVNLENFKRLKLLVQFKVSDIQYFLPNI